MRLLRHFAMVSGVMSGLKRGSYRWIGEFVPGREEIVFAYTSVWLVRTFSNSSKTALTLYMRDAADVRAERMIRNGGAWQKVINSLMFLGPGNQVTAFSFYWGRRTVTFPFSMATISGSEMKTVLGSVAISDSKQSLG